jgi:hypothetical protein
MNKGDSDTLISRFNQELKTFLDKYAPRTDANSALDDPKALTSFALYLISKLDGPTSIGIALKVQRRSAS